MTFVDPRPYGACPPGPLPRALIALTRALPSNWLGLRISMLLRRPLINWLGDRGVDTAVWGARLRLYPMHNSCEKNALFTPQLFDAAERKVLSAAIDAKLAAGRPFMFVDVGANVGLYSLFVASHAHGRARVLSIEPQPGVLDRLRFNIACNPGFDISVAPVAVADRDGEMELAIHARDAGGSRLDVGAYSVGTERVQVRARPLAAIVAEAGFATIDAMKIDIEGAEHMALLPFLSTANQALLPRLIVIEDHSGSWPVDLQGLMKSRGYSVAARSRINLMLELGTPPQR